MQGDRPALGVRHEPHLRGGRAGVLGCGCDGAGGGVEDGLQQGAATLLGLFEGALVVGRVGDQRAGCPGSHQIRSRRASQIHGRLVLQACQGIQGDGPRIPFRDGVARESVFVQFGQGLGVLRGPAVDDRGNASPGINRDSLYLGHGRRIGIRDEGEISAVFVDDEGSVPCRAAVSPMLAHIGIFQAPEQFPCGQAVGLVAVQERGIGELKPPPIGGVLACDPAGDGVEHQRQICVFLVDGGTFRKGGLGTVDQKRDVTSGGAGDHRAGDRHVTDLG